MKTASLPGASPETMASSVATPLERQFGHIASVAEMTSSSSLGSTSITIQFNLDRDIDAAARDVESAINAARGYLPTNLPSNPSYRKVNPADSPILIIGLTSDTLSKGQMYDAASTVMAQKLSQISGVGQVTVGGSALPGVRVELNPIVLNKYGISLEQVRTTLGAANANVPKVISPMAIACMRSEPTIRSSQRRITHRSSSGLRTAPQCASKTWARPSIRWKTSGSPAIWTASPRCYLQESCLERSPSRHSRSRLAREQPPWVGRSPQRVTYPARALVPVRILVAVRMLANQLAVLARVPSHGPGSDRAQGPVMLAAKGQVVRPVP